MAKLKLHDAIRQELRKLLGVYQAIPHEKRLQKNIPFNKTLVSPSDLIAYQIGWGTQLLDWYETGLKGKLPVMPGDGFRKWNYAVIALHFFRKYAYDSGKEQEQVFAKIAEKIALIAEEESLKGNLEAKGVFAWCALPSGTVWPLEKWIRVNSLAPYKRASKLLTPKPPSNHSEF